MDISKDGLQFVMCLKEYLASYVLLDHPATVALNNYSHVLMIPSLTLYHDVAFM